MIDETMPERVYSGRVFGSIRFETMPHKLQGISTEYIRGDLVTGDANEPLADGQLRWVKYSSDGQWIVGKFTNYGEDNGFFCNADRFDGDMPIETFFKIGPVIRPPNEEE